MASVGPAAAYTWACSSRSSRKRTEIKRHVGHRLSKIYTRTGDAGETGIDAKRRFRKHHPRIAAFGDLDELNAALGLLLAELQPGDIPDLLRDVQQRLFDTGAELCVDELKSTSPEHVRSLEDAIDEHNRELPPLKEFILPGGGPAAAACHFARAVCRRTERSLWTLQDEEGGLNPESLKYLNRLSDLLFVLARRLAESETEWRGTGRRRT